MDVGCNTGDFSTLAAESGASVVAIDADPAVVGQTWERATKHGLDILPLVVDISRPTPDVGWFNSECASFLSRASGKFDIVLFLAVIHHVAKDGVPLEQILRLVHQLTRQYAVVEFVEPQDPQFRSLIKGREQLFAHFNHEQFEAQCPSYFQISSSERVSPTRFMYFLTRK